MITPNTKITAQEILEECGVENAAEVFGAMRVRIGGIAGINKADHLINITSQTTSLEVIVGGDVYDLELAEGNKDDNAEIRTVTDAAKVAIEAKGRVATEKSEELQKVKQLAKNIKENDFSYVAANEEEEKHFERATEIAENEVAVEARLVEEAEVKPRIKVKSK